MIFGIHIANAGAKTLFSETTFKASNENTNTKAKEIPIAKLIPRPPLFFWEERESARKVSTIIETGIEVL